MVKVVPAISQVPKNGTCDIAGTTLTIYDRTDVESRSRNSIKTFSNSFSVERRFRNRQPSALAYSLESFIRECSGRKNSLRTRSFHLLSNFLETGGPQNSTGGVAVQHRKLNKSKALGEMAVRCLLYTSPSPRD